MTPARIESQVLPAASPDDAAPATSAASGPASPLAPSSIRQTPIDMPVPAGDGSYLPPGTSLAPPQPAAPMGDLPAAGSAPAAAPAVNEPDPDAATELPRAAPRLDPERRDKLLGYATATGAGLIAFGMFMPWSRVVIGASGAEGLFNAWGLASPGFVLVLFWALAVLTVSVIPNSIPVADRSGFAGLILGVFCLGLVEPYVIGGLGAGIGVLVVTLGAFLLTATGVLALSGHRHAAGD